MIDLKKGYSFSIISFFQEKIWEANKKQKEICVPIFDTILIVKPGMKLFDLLVWWEEKREMKN